MTGQEVVHILELLERSGVTAWLDGGWAIDAALGEQTRTHDDLDLVVELCDVDVLKRVLRERGYEVAWGRPPKSFELLDSDGRQVDVHPVTFEDGAGSYLMESGETWIYPAEGFAGHGAVLGRRVRCLTPEVQLLCHTGYEPHLASYDDVWVLARRFRLSVPEAYARPRGSYSTRPGN